MKRKFFIFFFFIALSNCCNAQDSALIHYLLKRITGQQVKADDYFLTGIFPSYITNKEKFSDRKKDNNIFFNGLIDYTLNEIKPLMNQQDQLLIDSILENSKTLY